MSLVRVFKQPATLALWALVYVRSVMSVNNLWNAMIDLKQRGSWSPGKDVVQDSLNLSAKQIALPSNFDETITALAEQLLSTLNRSTADSDLIDTIVRILSLPHARQRFGDNQISLLQQAILRPEELRAFINNVQTEEIVCQSCRQPFVEGELCSFARLGQRSSAFFCLNCRVGTHIRCSKNSEHLISLSSRASKKLSSTVCDYCTQTKASSVDKSDLSIPTSVVAPVPAVPIPTGWTAIPTTSTGWESTDPVTIPFISIPVPDAELSTRRAFTTPPPRPTTWQVIRNTLPGGVEVWHNPPSPGSQPATRREADAERLLEWFDGSFPIEEPRP